MAPERIGKYPIEKRLGSGGMGALYLARHPSLDHRVAIKILKDDYQDDPELRERFLREARSAARLKHDNIVVVHDFVVDEGHPFIVMEYIEGETLAKRLRERPPLPLDHRLTLIEELCSGLAHAHAAGIVHRDIKPANLMIDRRGVLKILDFGIARLGASGMTLEGMMMGSVNYMSPEQVVGRGVDHRTDIFAAGAVLYEVIALEQAFPGGIDSGVLNRVLHEGHTPLAVKMPDVDPELSEVVDRALQRDVERRYQSANDMRRDVARVRRRLAAGRDSDQTVVSRRDEFSPVDSARIAALKQQQISEYLSQGEEAFARGDFEGAQRSAERAIAVDSTQRAALDLYDRARFALESIRVRGQVERALELLAEGRFEEAEGAIRDASGTLPNVPGASELRGSLRDAASRIETARDRERRIGVSLDRARASLESGSLDTALRAVYEVLALDPDRSEARELEQQAKERLQARRELERAERGARAEVRRARDLVAQNLLDAADAVLYAIEPPSETIRTEVESAAAAVRQARHQAAVTAVVTEARDLVQDGRFTDALAALGGLADQDLSADARKLQSAATEGLRLREERQRKQQELEAGLAEVQSHLNAGDLASALQRLEGVARVGLKDERIGGLRERIAELGAIEHQRRQQEARDRQAERRVEAARQLAAHGQLLEAVGLLERHESSHPVIEQALAGLREQLAEHERIEAEARRRREEEERKLEAERQRQAEEARRRREEEERKLEAERQRKADEERLQREAEAARQRALEEERQRREAEARRQAEQERQQREAEARRQAEEERQRREEQERRQADQERQRREAEARRKAEEERERREAQARRLAEEARRQQEEEARRRAEAEAAREREAQRIAEERRREEEERRRQEEVTVVVTRVRGLADHRAALDELRELDTIVPNDTQVRTLIREREQALEAEAAARAAREAAAATERARQERLARDRRASEAVDQAHRLFAAGQHADALSRLREAETHDAVTAAISALDGRLREIERKRALEERRARRAAAVASIKRTATRPAVLAGIAGLVVAVAVVAWLLAPRPQPTDTIAGPSAAPPVTASPTPPTPAPLPEPVAPQPPAPTVAPVAPTPGARAGGPPAARGATVVEPGRGTPPAVRGAPPVSSAPSPTGTPPAVQTTPVPSPRPIEVPVAPPPVQTPVPQPAPPPVQPVAPPAPSVNIAAERSAIRALVSRYIDAFESMDERRIRAIDPAYRGLDARSRVLLRSRQLTLTDESIDIAENGQTARFTATQQITNTWNRAEGINPPPSRLTWKLVKLDGEWRVQP